MATQARLGMAHFSPPSTPSMTFDCFLPWRRAIHINPALKKHFNGDENADKDVIHQQAFTANSWQCLCDRKKSAKVRCRIDNSKLGRISVRRISSRHIKQKSDTYRKRAFSIPVAGIAYIELHFSTYWAEQQTNFEEASQP